MKVLDLKRPIGEADIRRLGCDVRLNAIALLEVLRFGDGHCVSNC